MWRVRLSVALSVAVSVMIFGAAVAYGWWWWNAQIDVEGVDVRTVWTVVDDEHGADNYFTTIGVLLPLEAQAEVIEQAKNEEVHLQGTNELECGIGGIEAVVGYVVEPLDGAIGTKVAVKVTADGETVGHGTGKVGEPIVVEPITIPGTCSGPTNAVQQTS